MRFFLHLNFILLFLIGIVFAGNAQNNNQPNGHNSCGFDNMRKSMVAKDPNYSQKEQQFNDKIRQLTIAKQNTQSNLRSASEECLIPVVFHIVMPTGQTVNQFLPDLNLQARIDNCLSALNNAFGGLAPYSGINSKKKFIIAQRDKNGNYTPGFTQLNHPTMSNLSAVNSGTDLNNYDDGLINTIVAQNGGTANFLFPNSQYINIIVVNTLTENNLSTPAGYANFPYSSNPDITSDVIILSKNYFGAADRNICIIHEMGHFFGLYHTFQNCKNGNCDPSQESSCTNTDCTKYGDLVCDTPPDASANPNSTCSGSENSCTGDALNDLVTNYMDYGDVACKNSFTQGQIDRMNAVLSTGGFRASLCGSPGTLNLCPKEVLSFDVSVTNSSTNVVSLWPNLVLVNSALNLNGFSYVVDFGDGTTVTTYDATNVSGGITHAYSTNQTYQITIILEYRVSPVSQPSPECARPPVIKSFTSQCSFSPTFTSSKTNVAINESITFTNASVCPVTTTGACTYSWLKDGVVFSSNSVSATDNISSVVGIKQVQLKMTYNGCVSISEPQAIEVGGNLCPDKRYSKFIASNQILYFDNNVVKNDYTVTNVAFWEAAALICDKSTGEVVLYTNGSTIYGKDKSPISGGYNIFGAGQTSSHQGSLIFQHPDPNKKNLYFVFAAGTVNYNESLRYVIVDIKQGVNGAVIGSVVELASNISEKMVAITKPDGAGYFLLVHKIDSKDFLTVEINASGVLPPIPSTGITILQSEVFSNNLDKVSGMMINRQGTQLAITYGAQNKIEIYNYNSQTGLVGSRLKLLDNIVSPIYVQFSPDGTKLYVASADIRQYDLNAADIVASAIILPFNIITGYIQTTYDQHLILFDIPTSQLYEIKVPNAPALQNGCGLTPILTLPDLNYTDPLLSQEPIDITQKTNFVISGLNCVKPNVKGSVYTLNVPVNPVNRYQWSINQSYPPLANIVGSGTGSSVTLDFSSLSGTIELQCQVTGPCGIDVIKKIISIDNSCLAPTCTIEIKTSNNNTEPAVLIPTCHPSVTLNASTGFVTYTWEKDGVIIPNAIFSTLVVSQAGVYKVTGVDAQNCSATSAFFKVADKITITGDNQICPGEKASLNVSIEGVVGNYFVQWFQNGSTTSTTAPSGTAGLYSAMVVLPTFAACTLTTAPKLVDLLTAPSPYTVGPQGPVYICSSDAAVTLSAMAPSTTAVPITSYSWNTGALTQTISTNTPGYYHVTATGSNGCSSISNRVLVLAPTITITQHCNSDGTVKLTANQNINGSNYVWKNAAGTPVGTTQSINVSGTATDTYTVTSNDTRCNAAASTLVCPPSNTNLGTNLVTRGDFNISTTASPICTNYAVSSDLTCSDATTTPLNAGNWPSNFKITSNAANENQNKWTGTGFVKVTEPTDIYCLIADGRVIDQKQRVWYQQVAVENCATYTFSVFVKNIIVNEAEVPKVSLKIGNYFIKSKTLYANSQSNWVELTGTWRSNATGNVEISVILDGGGWVGRDIAVDEIYFAKTNCTKATPIGRICNAVAEVGVDKFICGGQNVQIGDNQTNAGLTYSWTAPGGYTSTALNPTVNPATTTVYTLVVTDNVNNCSATDFVTVNVVVPSVTIAKDLTTGCAATQIKASLFNGVPNAQYEWWVNSSPVATNSTGIFSLAGIANGAIVKCRLVTACSSTIFSNSITVATGNVAPVTATQTAICSGTSTQLHANMSGGTAPYTYTWTASIGAVPAAEAEPVVTPTATTTYSLTFKDANNCTFTGSVVVTVNALPQAATIMPAIGCVGVETVVTVNYGSGNTLTSLTEPSFMTRGTTIQGSGYKGFRETINATGTGNFVAVSTSSQGCERTTILPFSAYTGPDPMVVSFSANPACPSTSVTVTGSYGTGNTLVGLTLPSKLGITGQSNLPGVFTYTADVLSVPGTGNVVGISKNIQGCSTTVSVPFTALPKPAMPPIASTGTLICSGSPILLSTDVVATSYQWYNGSALIAGATNSTYNTAVAGAYKVRITDANTCSNTSGSITLTTSNLVAPRVHVDDATDTYCASLPLSMNVGTTLQLNGTNQYVNVSGFNYPASGSGLPNGGPITVEFWIKSTNTYNTAFSIGGLDNPNRAIGIMPHTDGNLYWDYGNTAANGRLSVPFTSYVNKWTHVALVSAGKGGNFKAIYLNGTLVASGAVSDGPNVALSGLTIGKWLTTYAGGKIDEFRIWNKVLSAAEVQAAMTGLYEAGTPNLMGSWGFDEASGTTVNNDAFFAQTGTMMNSATRAPGTASLTYTWSPAAYLNTSTGMSVIPNTTVVRTYTVKGMDASGCSAYAQVVATPISTCKDGPNGVALVEEVKTDWDVNVFPNPTQGDVHISFVNVSDDTDLSLEVIGMDGAVIFNIAHISVNEICNLKELPSGLYLIRAKKDEQMKIKKVLVVK